MTRNISNKSNTYIYFTSLLLVIGLASCTVPTPYAPRTEGSSTGYSDERLTQNRFRVTFAGNSATSRTVVEDYLLYRAAQVTLDSGYAAFEFDTRDTRAKTTYFSTFDSFPYGPGYRHFGWYWHSWAFDDDLQSQPITRYEAYAEIVMLTPEQAKSEVHALDAHDVLTRLGPRVLPPPPPH